MQGLAEAIMTKKENKISELPKVTTRGSKVKALDALNNLGVSIQKLALTQKALVLAPTKDSDSVFSDELRLQIYDKSLSEIVLNFESLATQISVKQAGGRNLHKEFTFAYQIAKEHYKETRKFIRAKNLVREVNKYLSGKPENPDINGNESMSEKIARECIKVLKISLPHEDI